MTGRKPDTLLWCKPLKSPAAVAPEREAQPVVQAIFASLPEFDQNGYEPIPAPVRGSRHLVRELGTRRFEAAVQVGPVREDRALG